ncbi:hypothetical protein MVLG_00784 [Microbotryum lychnidis-dioicae p1A1 Lamole]|uniref:NodB homology domain-containing protein n=1 Tax=Microbotryum lychnidis-dioicae (strain p1A1 Lamole / MvSl-1064) TaxID=683840 RepID=U5H044_USTV1|nr:hypothetical protein MVLG_00784 [Microbotryum lychnidis-dioicae p1A1 Lamole]|eukprot:KDE09066.1 hypothetical protein MVLG_00784 [Microbotryum lychnidis-dioicae p1A1 Lamole]
MLVSFKPFGLVWLCMSVFVSATFGRVTKDPKTPIVKGPKAPVVKEPKTPLVFQECKKYTYSKDIGKLFKRKGVEGKATFFINGYNYGCIYNKENVNALRARYHEGHADLVNLSSVQIVKQVELLETAVERILGVRLGMFIAPYDSIDEKAAKVIRDKGYKIVRWSLDSGDTTFYLGRPQSSVNLIRKWIKKASGKSGIGLFDEVGFIFLTCHGSE